MGALIRGFLAKNKRQKLTILAVGFIVYVLALSGIFSYFHGSDAVTNRISAAQGSVTIQEPNWDSTGQYKARASEPGMKIEKDPSGYNNGQVDLYIRLKMTIELSNLSNEELGMSKMAVVATTLLQTILHPLSEDFRHRTQKYAFS